MSFIEKMKSERLKKRKEKTMSNIDETLNVSSLDPSELFI